MFVFVKKIGKSLLSLYDVGSMSGLTEVLFMERCLILLKKGGRMGMVLPEGVLNTSNLQKIREYFEGKAKIILICSIPQDVFIAAGATVKPSLVFFKRFTEEEELQYLGAKTRAEKEIRQKYVVDKMIADNGFAMLKKQLAELLYSTNPIEKRWDVFLKSIKGMGPATISELLTYANPQEYVIFNKTTILCYGYLDIPDMPKYNYQYTGKKYAEVCAIAKKIAAELKKAGADDYDLLAVDYFMWDEILPLAEKKSPVSPATPEVKKPVTVKDSNSLHDEIKEKLVAIGELLGFDSRSEVKITTGAVVDAVWEAKIGNMGKAIYVFEVQSKGSIDSLILNLKKAQSNAAVQAVVAVADEEQLAKIIQESAGVIDEKSLRTWDSEDVLAVYDALVRAHESINKLALVPESF